MIAPVRPVRPMVAVGRGICPTVCSSAIHRRTKARCLTQMILLRWAKFTAPARLLVLVR